MFSRTKSHFLFTMATSLALLGVLRALTIDSQLTVIKNDCYERLAIGQRLGPKDVYKTSHVNTVLDCQLTCTAEKESCKSFSFGIGVKGNGTCELSTDAIKETADLKPIGTKADTDFDLYIKKLGCTLVIDKNNPAFDHYQKPQPQDSYKPAPVHEKPIEGVSYGPPPSDSYEKPSTTNYGSSQNKPPSSGYGPPPSKPSYNKPQENVEHVQTVVSISTGPQRPVLHPYQDILVGEGLYNYARPPFRPPALNYPYDKPYYKPRPDDYVSRPSYKPRPDDYPVRPEYSPRPHRPDLDRYDSRPGGSQLVPYGQRPIPEKYASYIPRPEDYYFRPKPNDDYYKPKPDDYYRPRPPSDDYHRPNPPADYNHRPNPPNDGYGQRPHPPNDGYDHRPNPSNNGYDQRPNPPNDGYGHRPNPPNGYDQRPNPPNDGYGERPNPPNDGYSQRPKPPFDDYIYRPKPPLDDYNHRPKPPIDDYQRPKPPISDYHHRPNPPSDYNHRPNPPPDYNHRPNRPSDYNSRPNPPGDYNPRPNPPPDYNHRPNPPSDYNSRPNPPSDYNSRPNPPSDYNSRPNPPSDYNSRPNPPSDYNSRPEPPSDYDSRPNPPSDYNQRPKPPSDDYRQQDEKRPSKPANEYLYKGEIDRYDSRPDSPSKPNGGYDKPSNKPLDSNNPNGAYDNSIKGSSKPTEQNGKPIVTESVGPYGESITSIITELDGACFRRVLAGKRVSRGLVKRALYCERVEDCQRECAEEKRFACEGFNYRLDPTGRGKGECELLDIPVTHLDIGRDLYPDPDYDYYERDRNAARGNCKGHGYGHGYDGYYEKRPYHDRWDEDRNRYGNRRPRPDYGYDYHQRPNVDYDDGYRPSGNRRGDFTYHHSHHSDHSHDYHYEHHDHGPPPYNYKPYEPYLPPNRRPYDEDRYHNDRERDKNYWGLNRPAWGSYGTNYNPNEFDRKNYYLPPKVGGTKDWGQYGGSYGNGGINLHYNGYGHSQSFDFWGLNKYEEKFHNYGEVPPYKKPPSGGGSYLPEYPPYSGGGYSPHFPPPTHNGGGSYLPEPKPPSGGSYLPEPGLRPPIKNGEGGYLPEPPRRPPSEPGGYLPEPPRRPPGEPGGYLPEPPRRPPSEPGGYLPEPPRRPPNEPGSYLPLPGKPIRDDFYHNAVLPAEPRFPYRYDFLKDECSLRTATGFRLNKGIVKKFYAVPSIYECELLCFKEKDFQCASYAYRYTVSLTAPTDNCYLSNRSYKELDFYTDLQPDRDFDIYTMNNMKRCEQPIVHGKDNSDCFWRVRSAQRLDHKVVRDSLTVKSIVECQIECLKSVRFTCRAFSFRYGSPVIGGAIDNCQLTDWPFFELDPRLHLIPEPGFELYERGSYGHGCEPDHFGIRGKPWKDPGMRLDQLCYIGFGSPARLLRQATRKEIKVATEEECKAECSKFREGTLFQCMSFSYSQNAKWGPNCKLSDILQRDLLPNVDYVPDSDSWLSAWDNYNPECKALANKPVHNNHIGPNKEGGIRNRHDYDLFNALATWRVYSVSGWPCRRGTTCQENREAGFWFCELEGGELNAWDYCCRPDHQCGYSEGFPYQWCYVGPVRTQWRKCSDRYYPYIHNFIDRFDHPPHHWAPSSGPGDNYLPVHRPPPYRPGGRPDRPPAPPTRPPPRPSLDEYEMQFEAQFLDPPKPGGFGQPRHWPLSYLHKEMPPNNTDSEPRLMKAVKGRDPNPKFAAIQNLIDIIKSNDLKNVQYQITNESNKDDDILFVKIPLPTNFTHESKKSEKIVSTTTTTTPSSVSGPIDLPNDTKNNTKRSQKSLPTMDRFVPVYRRGYITRTNVTRTSRTL